MKNREELLAEINEASFAADDVRLYLDTHPSDEKALAFFKEQMKRRRQAMMQYALEFEPLTIDCMTFDCDCVAGTESAADSAIDRVTKCGCGKSEEAVSEEAKCNTAKDHVGVEPADHFRWVDGPKPWEGACEHVGV